MNLYNFNKQKEELSQIQGTNASVNFEKISNMDILELGRLCLQLETDTNNEETSLREFEVQNQKSSNKLLLFP